MFPKRNFHRGVVIVTLSAILIMLVATGFYLIRNEKDVPNELEFHRVLHVVDGDTILVFVSGSSERVRLLGIDTPEIAGFNTREECFGAEASDKANILLSREEVRLVGDSLSDDRDKFGRLLRYVYLKDGTLVNAELIRGGFATTYRNAEFERKDAFFKLEAQARSLRIGLWDACVTR